MHKTSDVFGSDPITHHYACASLRGVPPTAYRVDGGRRLDGVYQVDAVYQAVYPRLPVTMLGAVDGVDGSAGVYELTSLFPK